MIKNDHQLQIARTKVERLAEARDGASGTDRATYSSLLADVDHEIEEYLDIRDGSVQTFEVSSLDDLADALVKARISARLTQHEVAERLDIKEQMIQRYEAGGYENASLARIADVIDALGFSFHGWLGKSTLSATQSGTIISGGSAPTVPSRTDNVTGLFRVTQNQPTVTISAGGGNAA
jgi:DNA-binding XRE family transcriptional regulator